MKDKILKEFVHKFGAFAMTSAFGKLYNGAFDNEAKISEAQEFLSQALDEYADWKIKECLPEKKKLLPSITSLEALQYTHYNNGYNDCIDQILTNKDKIK